MAEAPSASPGKEPEEVTLDVPGQEGASLPPDSWEMANIDEQMSKISLNAAVDSSSFVRPQAASTEQAGTPSVASQLVGVEYADAMGSPCLHEDGVDFIDPESIHVLPQFESVDLFLREALQKPQDRLTILRLEQEVEKFVRDPNSQQLEFPYMSSSYKRLACHRVAQHYFLQTTVVDSAGKEGSRIVARKVKESRAPAVRLADIPGGLENESSKTASPLGKVAIKQRPQKGRGSGRDGGADGDIGGLRNPSKTVEERKVEYDRARARIFSREDGQVRVPQAAVGGQCDEGREVSGGQGGLSEEAGRSGLPLVAHMSLVRGDGGRGGRGMGRGNGRGKALLRDKEKERRDPDFDRNLDRYTQRFDPSLGPSTSPYQGQAVYAPVATYSSEFPQLGSASSRPNSGAHIPVVHMDQHMASGMNLHQVRGGWVEQMAPMPGHFRPMEAFRGYDPYSGPPVGPPHMHMPMYVSPQPPRGMLFPGQVLQPGVYPSFDQFPPQFPQQAGQSSGQPRRQ